MKKLDELKKKFDEFLTAPIPTPSELKAKFFIKKRTQDPKPEELLAYEQEAVELTTALITAPDKDWRKLHLRQIDDLREMVRRK